MQHDREAQELAASRGRLWHIAWILVGWVVVGSLANFIALPKGPAESVLFTIEELAYLSDKQTGAAWWIQLVLLHGGTVITWYIGWLLVDLVMERHFLRHWKERGRMKTIERAKDHVVICGAGRVGRHLAELLSRAGKTVVMVDSDADKVAAVKDQHLVVEGDARDEAVLRAAGLERAASLVSAFRETETNVMAVLAARRVRPSLDISARCDRAVYVETLKQAGATSVVLPEVACAEHLLQTLKPT